MAAVFKTQLAQSCSAGYLTGDACLARCYEVLGEMLRYRGYENVSFTCANSLELDGCMETDGVVAVATEGSREDKAVVFLAESRVGVKSLRAVAESNAGTQTAVMVVSIEGPTSFAKRDLSAAGVEFITFKQIFNDIAKHRLVPPHRRISCPDEQKAVAHRFCIGAPSQWPKLLLSDPMSVFGDFREGDIIEIRRKCVSGENIYYRRVG